MVTGNLHHDEIPETTTDPAIAALYQEIRDTSGLPGINLFYRRLAYAGADVLGGFWEQVAPLYRSRRLHDAGATLESSVTLPAVCVLDDPVLKAAGIAPDGRAALRATLRYFNEANAMHLALFSVIARTLDLAGTDVEPAAVTPTEPHSNGDSELLPLVSWEDTPPASKILIGALRDRLAPGLADTIRPTLLRHLAPYPVLIATLYGYVACNNDALVTAIEASRRDALAVAGTLSDEAAISFDPQVQAVVTATTSEFRQIIPVMLVLGSAMSRGFAQQNGQPTPPE